MRCVKVNIKQVKHGGRPLYILVGRKKDIEQTRKLVEFLVMLSFRVLTIYKKLYEFSVDVDKTWSGGTWLVYAVYDLQSL